jgi:uroporphyrinogen-III synthase
LAFTSANGVRAFAQRSGERALPVLAVGEATAAAAREVGFDRVTSAAGDVEALAWLIAETRGAGGGEILHASAAEPAGDLVGALTAAGVPARRLALYETRARRPDAAAIARLAPCAVVLVHSPRAGRVLAEILREHPRPGMTALCLSPTVAAPLADAPLAAVRAASAPTEDALMALLAQTAPRP